MPVLTFPAIQLMNVSVSELINDSDLQVQALKLIHERLNPLAIMGFMDLSVEVEVFGSHIHFTDDEVPNVVGSIITCEEDAINLKIPRVGDKRTGINIEAIQKQKKKLQIVQFLLDV